MVLGATRPFRYEPAWLEQLVGPSGALRDLAREYLRVDTPRDYFGRLLLDERGAARLMRLASVVHRDDRPQLEFVAARRFLDMPVEPHVLDSLLSFRGSPDSAGLGSTVAASTERLGGSSPSPSATRAHRFSSMLASITNTRSRTGVS